MDPLKPDSPRCETCDQILKCFETPKAEECLAKIGTVAELLPLNNSCSSHGPMIRDAIKELDRELQSRGRELKYKSLEEDQRNIEIVKFKNGTSISFFIKDEKLDEPLSLTKNLVYNKSESSHRGDAIILDGEWIDTKLIHRWKKECETNHDRCRFQRGIQSQGPVRPLLLIDTQDRCIVSAEDAKGDFVALSYCWGMPEPGKPYWFRNEKAILQALKAPKSLAPGSEFGEKLPKTIKDTIEMTQQVGERYLWIDSLCIVQDDDEMKSIELPKMSEIYASACLTIVAAAGSHADFGLPGFEFTKSRNLDQKLVEMGSERLVRPITFTHSEGEAYAAVAYYTRGWTFQEFLFGRRRLIVENQSVRWECGEAAWYEDLKDTHGLEFRGERWDANQLPEPNVEALNEIVNQYNTRQLGRKEDAFPAFCGFQRVLSRGYPHGFINGMPILFFDIALAWIPYSIDIYRRKAENSLLDPPSWSWIGWTGKVDITFSNDEYLVEDQEMNSLHVSKLVDWYTMTSLDASKKPILESSQASNEQFSLSKEPSLLFGKTHSATFHLGKCLYDSEDDIIFLGPWYHVRNSAGKWSGVLRAHNREDFTNLENASIELVAISKGHAPEKEQDHEAFGLMEWHVEERPRNGLEYHFYNVLLIQRDGDVAYRKAGGRIEARMWEMSAPQAIDLVLR